MTDADDKVVGIFTERDVLRRYLTSQASSSI